MKRFAVLAGSFVLTFALLVSVWMVGTGRSPLGGLAATPSPAPTPAPTVSTIVTPAPTVNSSPTLAPTASPTLAPTASPTPSAAATATTLLATPSPSPAPLRTVSPSDGPPPSGQPSGDSQTYTLSGKEFTTYQLPEDASLLLNGDSLVLRTTDDSPDVLWVVYRVDPTQLPAGATVYSISTAVCGHGSGQFWEVYGPTGSEPHEYEVVPPEADGCWHFHDAHTSDISAIVATMLDSMLVIDRVIFTVTFAA